jgi:hypothetical protein
MSARLPRLVGAILLGGVLVVSAAAPATAAPCDAYSQACPSPAASVVPSPSSTLVITSPSPSSSPTQGGTGEEAVGSPTPSPSPAVLINGNTDGPVQGTFVDAGTGTTLPFTGAQVVLLLVIALSALAAGIALVLAGRRRRPTAV